MNAIAFDTHAAADTLGDAGFTKAQVEALVEITRQTTSLPEISTLATKNDLLALTSVLAVLKSELTAKIDAAKLQGVTLVLSGVGAMLAIVTVLLKVL